MTQAARNVLEDCRGALDDLQDGIQGAFWRRRWICAVVLLRTVGYVLGNIDAMTSPTLKEVIDKEWNKLQKTRPEPKIFWEFIEMERNNILKEYQINAGQGITIRVPTLHLNLKTGEQYSDPPLPTLYHYTINSGVYKGRDQRDVLKEAIDWWQKYLDEIDRQCKTQN